MKCPNCGAELEDSVLFCRECGSKVEQQIPKKRFCKECGYEIPEGAKFCTNCGVRVDTAVNAGSNDIESPVTEQSANDNVTDSQVYENQSTIEKLKLRAIAMWSDLDKFGKIIVIALAIGVMLLLISILANNDSAVTFAVLQIAVLVVVFLMHIGKIKSTKNWYKYAAFAFAIFCMLINLSSYTKQTSTTTEKDSLESQQAQATVSASPTPEVQLAETNYTIEKGSSYSFMSDLQNVYIANAISNSIIQIERWEKSSSSAKSAKYDATVGTYKINDPQNGFTWVDDTHTAFVINMQDSESSRLSSSQSVVFTININNNDKFKGSDYDKKIACYSFQNDDRNLYRAIPLTEDVMKVEYWHRSSSTDSFIYGYDVGIVFLNYKDTDFEWTDDEQTAFTITMRYQENDEGQEVPALVAFVIENSDFEFLNVKSYLENNKGRASDEVEVPKSASSYKYDNYINVQENLEAAGFTNISTVIQYDIVWGITSVGEVASVSIDGSTDYDEGDIFQKDVEVIITYHMNYDDDPVRQAAKAAEAEATQTPTSKPTSTPTPTPKSVSYSTNDESTVKNGNTGVYSYKSIGGTYSNYVIIDFDNGYVYIFADGNGDETCDRLKIDSGDINSRLEATYHLDGIEATYGLYFKWKNQPNHLVLQDDDGFEYDYYPVELYKAESLRNSKTINDY